jgi:cobalamin biosynthesis Mg chelatase CobN
MAPARTARRSAASAEAQLKTFEAVVQNQDNREHDLLDSDDYYQFEGGMSRPSRISQVHAP